MLRFFQTSNPSLAFILSTLVVLITRIFLLLFPQKFGLSAEAFGLFLDKNSFIINEGMFSQLWVHVLLSGVLVLLHTAVINSMANEFKILGKQSYLVGWIYLVLMHLNPEFLLITPQLIALTLALFIFKSTYAISYSNKPKTGYFNIGLLLGLGIEVWSPMVALVLMVFWSMLLFTQLKIRNVALFIIGAFVPIVYLLSFYFLFDKYDGASNEFFSTFRWNSFNFNTLLSVDKLLLILPIILSMVGFFITLAHIQGVVKEVRHYFQLTFILLFTLILMFLFQNENDVLFVMMMFFPMSILISMFINTIKHSLFAEIAHLSVLLPPIIYTLLILIIK